MEVGFQKKEMSNIVKMALMFKERTGKVSAPRERVGSALTPFRFSKTEERGVRMCMFVCVRNTR